MEGTRRFSPGSCAIGRFVALLLILAPLLTASAEAETSLDSVRELASQGRGDEALGDLDRLLADNPGHREGLFLKGVLLVELRRTAEAERVFTGLIRSHPELPEPYNNLAVLQAAGGRYDEAVDTLQQALETHSSYETAYSNLTKIYGQLASEAYDRALSDGDQQRSEVVELVLLGNISPVAEGPGAADSGGSMSVVEEPLRPAPDEPLPASGEPAMRSEEADPVDAVNAWAAAWADQRVDDYIAAYSGDYSTPGLSRSEWERQRRDRLTRPEYI